jgi:hypothetical protein
LLFNIPGTVHAIAQEYKPGKLGENFALAVPRLDLKKGASRAEIVSGDAWACCRAGGVYGAV